MPLLGPATPRQLSVGIALVRIITGVIFLVHGLQKFLVFTLAGTTSFFTQAGVPAPTITAPLVSILEVAAGIALILGLLTRLAALGLAINMLGVIFIVHLKAGFFLPNGVEFALVLLVLCVGLMIAGPGALSVDDAIASRRSAPAVP